MTTFWKKDQLEKHIRRPKNKFGAQRSYGRLTDRYYDSGAERDRCEWLRVEEMEGRIRDLEFQPVVKLVEGFEYRPDSKYVEVDTGRVIYEDVKGAETQRFRDSSRLWRYHGPATLRIVKRRGKDQPFLVTKEITPIL